MTGTGALEPRVWAGWDLASRGLAGRGHSAQPPRQHAGRSSGPRCSCCGRTSHAGRSPGAAGAGGRLGQRAPVTGHAGRGRRGEPPGLGDCALRFGCAYISWAEVAPSGKPEGASGRRSPPLSPFWPVLPEGKAGREARGVVAALERDTSFGRQSPSRAPGTVASSTTGLFSAKRPSFAATFPLSRGRVGRVPTLAPSS